MESSEPIAGVAAKPKRTRWSYQKMVAENRAKKAAKEKEELEREEALRRNAEQTPAVQVQSQTPPTAQVPIPASAAPAPVAKRHDITVSDAEVTKRHLSTEQKRRFYILSEKDDDFIIECLRKHKTIGFIADKIGCCYKSLNQYIHKVPEIQDVFTEAKDRIDDLVQVRIYEKIDRGDWPAIEFYATHQMRHRGYGDEPVDRKIDEPQRIVFGKIPESEIPPETPDDAGAALVRSLMTKKPGADETSSGAAPVPSNDAPGSPNERPSEGGEKPIATKEADVRPKEPDHKPTISEMNGYDEVRSENPEPPAEQTDDMDAEFVMANGDGTSWLE